MKGGNDNNVGVVAVVDYRVYSTEDRRRTVKKLPFGFILVRYWNGYLPYY